SLGRPGLEALVSLPERAAIVPPRLEETMFHVEHPPVQPTPSFAGSAGDQLVHGGIQHYRGKQTCRLRHAFQRLPGKARFGTVAVTAQAEHAGRAAIIQPGDQLEGSLRFTDEAVRPAAAEGAAMAKEINGLEETGLAGGVGPDDPGERGVEFQVGGLEASEVAEL